MHLAGKGHCRRPDRCAGLVARYMPRKTPFAVFVPACTKEAPGCRSRGPRTVRASGCDTQPVPAGFRRHLVRSLVHHRLHEPAADAEVLCARVNGDWANTCDDGTLIEAIAAHDAAVAVPPPHNRSRGQRTSSKAAGMAPPHPGKSQGKAVNPADRGEGVVADLSAGRAVFRRGPTEHHVPVLVSAT